MDPVGTLVGFAEISLALAGFAAIVLVLATRTASLDPVTTANVRIMIANAVGSAFASLVGVAILAIGVSPPLAWVMASAFILVGGIALGTLNFLLVLRHLEAQDPLVILWWSFGVAAGAVHFANVLGIIGSPSFGLFFLGLVILLGQAAAMFVTMVYVLFGRSPA